MDIIDFTKYKLSDRNLEYGGRAGEKRGILINGEYWFLKFPKTTQGMNRVTGLSYVTSPLSEFIGSNIFSILGYDVHKTLLGVCHDTKRYKVVCACKDFIIDDKNEILIPYTALRNDTNSDIMERHDTVYSSPSNIYEVIFQLKHNEVFKNLSDSTERFFEMIIIDMLINNSDRNEDNWGVIKFKDSNTYKMAPIYDCGNSFYDKASEDKIENLLSNDLKLQSSSINGVTAYEDDMGNRVTNMTLLDIDNEDLNKAVIKVYNNVISKFEKIKEFINSIPENFEGTLIMSNIRKEYYIKTFELRLNKILKPKFDKLMQYK